MLDTGLWEGFSDNLARGRILKCLTGSLVAAAALLLLAWPDALQGLAGNGYILLLAAVLFLSLQLARNWTVCEKQPCLRT